MKQLARNLTNPREGFVETIKFECLNQFVISGERHLRTLINAFFEHYHIERLHQGIGGQRTRSAGPTNDHGADSEVVCRSRLGGIPNFCPREVA
jgi:hypothetical protein